MTMFKQTQPSKGNMVKQIYKITHHNKIKQYFLSKNLTEIDEEKT